MLELPESVLQLCRNRPFGIAIQAPIMYDHARRELGGFQRLRHMRLSSLNGPGATPADPRPHSPRPTWARRSHNNQHNQRNTINTSHTHDVDVKLGDAEGGMLYDTYRTASADMCEIRTQT